MAFTNVFCLAILILCFVMFRKANDILATKFQLLNSYFTIMESYDNDHSCFMFLMAIYSNHDDILGPLSCFGLFSGFSIVALSIT